MYSQEVQSSSKFCLFLLGAGGIPKNPWIIPARPASTCLINSGLPTGYCGHTVGRGRNPANLLRLVLITLPETNSLHLKIGLPIFATLNPNTPFFSHETKRMPSRETVSELSLSDGFVDRKIVPMVGHPVSYGIRFSYTLKNWLGFA